MSNTYSVILYFAFVEQMESREKSLFILKRLYLAQMFTKFFFSYIIVRQNLPMY